MNKKVLNVEKRELYELRTEEITVAEGESPTTLESAYTLAGDYVGNEQDAERLIVQRGISPELRKDTSQVCSIGFQSQEQKWYGGSHRAIYCFGVGSEVKKGDCGYIPDTHEEMWESVKYFYEAEVPEDDKQVYHDPRVRSVVVKTPDGLLSVTGERQVQNYRTADDGEMIPTTEEWVPLSEDYPLGSGEWTAGDMADAKKMAMDFAEGVS